MRRDAEQRPTFAAGLEHQMKVSVLEVADASVNQSR